MSNLLGRSLTPGEQALLERILLNLRRLRSPPRDLWRTLGLPAPDPFLSVVLSLIASPPASSGDLALCSYLLEVPEFLPFLSSAHKLPRHELIRIARALLKLDPRFDAKLANSLFARQDPDPATILHVLGVPDVISPGGRLTPVLTRLQRDCPPAVASKVVLQLARRVSNPKWVEDQLSSDDPRLRANDVEALWCVDTPAIRARLKAASKDVNNRVVRSALMELYLLKDQQASQLIEEILGHAQPEFRTAAVWVMGKTGEDRYRTPLQQVLKDSDVAVREAARRALADLPETLAASSLVEDPDPPAASSQPENPIVQPEFEFHLIGCYKRFS